MNRSRGEMSRNVVYQQGAAVVVVPQQPLYGEPRDTKPQERCACKICMFGAVFIATGIFIIFLVKVRSSMFQFLGTRRETAYIMSLTGIILGIFLMVGALSLLFDIEKRQQRRANQRMQQTMLVNNELSTFERPDHSSEDEAEEMVAAHGMHKRCQVIPSCTASPAGRLATYSQTSADMGVPIDIHPKSPSRHTISDPFQSSGSRGAPLRSLGPLGALGAYSISGSEMPHYHRPYPRPVAGREYVHHQHSTAPAEDQIISCQTFSSCSEDSSPGLHIREGSHPEAPPAYESESNFSSRTRTSGAQGFLPHYQQPPPYTPYSDDPPPPYSP